MSRTIWRASVLLLIGVVALPTIAGEGRTPIYQYPTVITQPGKYIVTRDINGGGGPAPVIDVQASPVDIDLNGFTLSNFGGTAPIIYTFGGVPLTIRNGTLMGGTTGIEVFTGADDIPMYKVIIEDVNVMNPERYGTYLYLISDFALRSNNIAFSGDVAIYVTGGSPTGISYPVMGTIEHNRIEDCSGGITVVH